MANNIVPMEQISMIVQNLKDFKLVEVGSPDWLVQHGHIVSLGQQAALEIAHKREEQVKEELMIYDKIIVLVNEVICARIWQQNVLPALLEINPNPKATFLIYATIFHEGAAVALLDMALFHENACEALGDATVDLIDYCVYKINDYMQTPEDAPPSDTAKQVEEMSILSEIERQQNETSFKISLRCLSLMHYLSMNNSKVPLGCLRRIVDKYDVPMLMIDVLKRKPWMRTTQSGKFQKFIDEKWQSVDELEAIKTDKYEAQVWIFLRQVLLSRELMVFYQLTENRRVKFTQCLHMLTEFVLDQLPTLIELKQILTQASISKGCFGDKSPLMLDIVPHVFKRLNTELMKNGGGAGIAKYVEPLYFSPTDENLFELAQRLSQFYNTDVLADLEEMIDKQAKMEEEEPQLQPQKQQQQNEDVKVPIAEPEVLIAEPEVPIVEPEVPPAEPEKEKEEELNEPNLEVDKEYMPGTSSNILSLATKRISSCAICKNDTTLICSQCLGAHYCSKACQKLDWLQHKFYCKKF